MHHGGGGHPRHKPKCRSATGHGAIFESCKFRGLTSGVPRACLAGVFGSFVVSLPALSESQLLVAVASCRQKLAACGQQPDGEIVVSNKTSPDPEIADFGGLAGPGSRKTLPKGGGRSPSLFKRVSRAPGACQTPKIGHVRVRGGSCIARRRTGRTPGSSLCA